MSQDFLDTYYPRLLRRASIHYWYLDARDVARDAFDRLLTDAGGELDGLVRDHESGASEAEIESRLSAALVKGTPGLGDLIEDYNPELLRRARRRYPHLDPEALVQDTWVYLLDEVEEEEARALRRILKKNGGTLAEKRCMKSIWDALCGIAANRRRGRDRYPGISVDPQEHANRPSGGSDHGDEIEYRDLLDKLVDCIRENTSSREFLVWQLSYVLGNTPREIAKMLPAANDDSDYDPEGGADPTASYWDVNLADNSESEVATEEPDGDDQAVEIESLTRSIYRIKEKLVRVFRKCRERLGL